MEKPTITNFYIPKSGKVWSIQFEDLRTENNNEITEPISYRDNIKIDGLMNINCKSNAYVQLIDIWENPKSWSYWRPWQVKRTLQYKGTKRTSRWLEQPSIGFEEWWRCWNKNNGSFWSICKKIAYWINSEKIFAEHEICQEYQ